MSPLLDDSHPVNDPLFDRPPPRRGSGSLKWDLYPDTVLPFWVADMDFESPPEIIAALEERIRHGVFGYALPRPSDTEAVVNYLRRRHGVHAKPSWIVWLPGLVPGLSVASGVARDRGARTALVPVPAYPPFLQAPADAGISCIRVPLAFDARDRAQFDFAAIENALTPETGLFFLCNAQNPTGRVFTREELEAVIEICNRHELMLCSDEVHCDLVFDEQATPHVSLLAFEGEIRDRMIVLMSASKTYNIAGIGCAFAVIPDPKLRRTFRRVKGCWVPPVNALGYIATQAAFRHGEAWRRRLIAYLRGNVAVVREYFEKGYPGLKVAASEATYLAWIDVRTLGLESPKSWFESHGIGLSDGSDFGCPGFVRLNFGCARSLLLEGLQRMGRAIEAISAQA